MTAPAWLDAMPAIPLARAVPVVRVENRLVMRVGTTNVRAAPTPARSVLCIGAKDDHPPSFGWRVDLDDPQGFAYALTLRCRSGFADEGAMGAFEAMVWRHLRGETTDADRYALAKALAEVTTRGGR